MSAIETFPERGTHRRHALPPSHLRMCRCQRGAEGRPFVVRSDKVLQPDRWRGTYDVALNLLHLDGCSPPRSTVLPELGRLLLGPIAPRLMPQTAMMTAVPVYLVHMASTPVPSTRPRPDCSPASVGYELFCRGLRSACGSEDVLSGTLADLEMRGSRVRLKRRIGVNLGGIAKGFAADRAIATWCGVRSAMSMPAAICESWGTTLSPSTCAPQIIRPMRRASLAGFAMAPWPPQARASWCNTARMHASSRMKPARRWRPAARWAKNASQKGIASNWSSHCFVTCYKGYMLRRTETSAKPIVIETGRGFFGKVRNDCGR
jgi:hypothetical protein